MIVHILIIIICPMNRESLLLSEVPEAPSLLLMMPVCLGPMDHRVMEVEGCIGPATAICLAAREGNLQFLSEQPQAKLLLLDGNGDSVITHAVDRGNMRSLEFLLSLQRAVLFGYTAEPGVQERKLSSY